jgi:hypothetical protein
MPCWSMPELQAERALMVEPPTLPYMPRRRVGRTDDTRYIGTLTLTRCIRHVASSTYLRLQRQSQSLIVEQYRTAPVLLITSLSMTMSMCRYVGRTSR